MQKAIWQDCAFTTWAKHYDSPPDPGLPAACVLCVNETVGRLLDGGCGKGLLAQFERILKRNGFWWERMDGTTVVFLASDAQTSEAYARLADWNWTSSLITPDFALIHESVFDYFTSLGVNGLLKLSPRDFEVYLDSLFQGRGYRSVLGPGTNDGGVDLRLYSSEITGEVLTLVQAKRYARQRAVRLDAVQALTAAVDYEPAQNGLFVTTSRFLPGAQRFAERKAPHIKLLTGDEVIKLTELAARDVAQMRAQLVQYKRVSEIIKYAVPDKLDGRVFHATTGYGMIDNRFALCMKSSEGAALLSPIPSKVLKNDGHGQAGYHVPDIGVFSLMNLKAGEMFVAKITARRFGSSPGLWGNRNLYTIWDGEPCHFDFCD